MTMYGEVKNTLQGNVFRSLNTEHWSQASEIPGNLLYQRIDKLKDRRCKGIDNKTLNLMLIDLYINLDCLLIG